MVLGGTRQLCGVAGGWGPCTPCPGAKEKFLERQGPPLSLQAVRCCWGLVMGTPRYPQGVPRQPGRAALRFGGLSRAPLPSCLPEAGLGLQLPCHPPNPGRGAATRACPQGPAAPWPCPGEEDKLIPR